MIENIDLEAGTFEFYGQVIQIPEGVDISEYIGHEIEMLEVHEAVTTEDETV